MRAWRALQPRLVVAALALATALLGTAVYDFLKAGILGAMAIDADRLGPWTNLGLGLLSAALTLAAGLLAYEQAKPLLRTRAQVIKADQGYRCSILIMTLSAFNRGDPRLPQALSLIGRLAQADEGQLAACLDLLCGSGEGEPFARWPWQQPLRLIRHHRHRLQRIILIVSPEAKDQIPDFQRLVRPFLHVGSRIDQLGDPLNLEEYNALEERIQEAVAMTERNAPQHDICIDITSGPKTWSVVAMLASLNTDILFSYVQSNPPYEVLVYDVKLRQ